MSVTSGDSVNVVYPDLPNDSPSTGASSAKNQKNLGNNSSLDLPGKIENFKAWSSTAMKCTKQVIEEKLGTTSPTRDPEMEGKIDEVNYLCSSSVMSSPKTNRRILSYSTESAPRDTTPLVKESMARR
ncbi:hypothetical protein ACTXT7_003509 [Hymenolepis weldensis]